MLGICPSVETETPVSAFLHLPPLFLCFRDPGGPNDADNVAYCLGGVDHKIQERGWPDTGSRGRVITDDVKPEEGQTESLIDYSTSWLYRLTIQIGNALHATFTKRQRVQVRVEFEV